MDANMAALINRNSAINCQQENVKRYENGSFDEQHILSKNMYVIFLRGKMSQKKLVGYAKPVL